MTELTMGTGRSYVSVVTALSDFGHGTVGLLTWANCIVPFVGIGDLPYYEAVYTFVPRAFLRRRGRKGLSSPFGRPIRSKTIRRL